MKQQDPSPRQTRYRNISDTARRQRIKLRNKRLRAGEPLSSDEEDDGVGMGVRLIQHMKEGSNETELIESFEKALAAPRPPPEEGMKVYVAPSYDSTEVYWAPVEEEHARETALIEERRAERVGNRRAVAMRKVQEGEVEDNKEVLLEHLGLGDDDVESVSNLLQTKCSELTTLSLAVNHLGPQGAVDLSPLLPSLASLTVLNLGHNQLCNAGAATVASCLTNSVNLRKLLLQSNSIGPEVPAEIQRLTQLQTLSLRGNLIESLPQGFIGCFREIDLDRNTALLRECLEGQLQVEAEYAKMRALRVRGMRVMDAAWKCWEKLDVKGARRKYESAVKCFAACGASQEMEVPLSELRDNIERRDKALGSDFVLKKEDPTQHMVSESIERGLKALEKGTGELSLFSQRVGDSGATGIAKQLEGMGGGYLTWLDLSNCDIGPSGAKELSVGYLSKTVTLKTLWLARNRLGDEGATHLAGGLQHNTSLAKLDLSANNIRGDGIALVANSLKANPSFRSLCASFNWVGDTGGKEVAMALKNMCNLQEVDLSGSGVGGEGTRALSVEFKTHQGILFGKMWR